MLTFKLIILSVYISESKLPTSTFIKREKTEGFVQWISGMIRPNIHRFLEEADTNSYEPLNEIEFLTDNSNQTHDSPQHEVLEDEKRE